MSSTVISSVLEIDNATQRFQTKTGRRNSIQYVLENSNAALIDERLPDQIESHDGLRRECRSVL